MGVRTPNRVEGDPPEGLPDGWEWAEWDDGNWQVWNDDLCDGDVYIEKIDAPKSRRKNWTIVDRRSSGDWTLYAPKIAGPFPTLEAAIVAYKIIRS